MRTLTFVVALAFTANFAAAQQKPKPTAKEREIRKLLELTGAGQLGAQVMDQMIQTFRARMPKVPATFWTELQKDMNSDELVEKVIPIYDKQLSEGEIKDLIKFYETPTGRKVIKVMPAITQESMQVGQAWGREIGEKVVARLKQKGLEQ